MHSVSYEASKMACRFSRQLFYILAAVCMCSWIGITLVVIKTGGGNKRIEFDLNTPFVLNADTVHPNMNFQNTNSVNKENEHTDSHEKLKDKQNRERKYENGHENINLINKIDDGENEDWNRNIVHDGEGDDGKTGKMNAELDEHKEDSGILKWNKRQNWNNKIMGYQKKPVVIEGDDEEPDAEIIERNIENNDDIEDSKEGDKAAKYRNEKIDEDAHEHVFDDGELEQGDREDDNDGDFEHEGQNNEDDGNEMHLNDVYYNKESTENDREGKDKENDKVNLKMPRFDSDDNNEEKPRGDGGVKENIYNNNGNGQKKVDTRLPSIDNNYEEDNYAEQLEDQKEEMNDVDVLQRGINHYRENTTKQDKNLGVINVLEAENYIGKENKPDHLSKDTLLPNKGKNPLARLHMLTNDNNTIGSERIGAERANNVTEIASKQYKIIDILKQMNGNSVSKNETERNRLAHTHN